MKSSVLNTSARLCLCLACVIVAALEAPRAMHVLAEDLRGPYDGAASIASADGHYKLPAVMAWTDRSQEAGDAFDGDTVISARVERR